jgi:hypothetical protein
MNSAGVLAESDGAYTLEQILVIRSQTDQDAKELLPRYEAMKSFLAKEYYPWIQANCPYYTDHGIGHINSVIHSASLLLQRHLIPTQSSLLTSVDIFLILSAILWHDVGNVLGRTDHAQRIAEMTNEIKTLGFPDPALHRLVVEIAQAHAGKDGLDKARSETDCTISRTFTVYPRALSAVVRFADEISENRSRISVALLGAVPAENQIYWQYANAISASRPDPHRERVVLTVEMHHDIAVQRYSCPKDLLERADGTGSLSLIEYLILRLEKMNNERAYCEPHFRRYAPIREIEVRLSILRQTQLLDSYELVVTLTGSGLSKPTYPSIPLFDPFFSEHPKWKPEAIAACTE